MAADDWYKPNPRPQPARQPKAGELLFEFHARATHTFWRCELRDNGEFGQGLDLVGALRLDQFRGTLSSIIVNPDRRSAMLPFRAVSLRESDTPHDNSRAAFNQTERGI